ncbi:ankyrin repeat-containing domain protein [Aspergillus crustosus]
MAYNYFRTIHSDSWPPLAENPILDIEGTPLYETDDRGLLLTILRTNKLPHLTQYISAYSKKSTLTPAEVYYHDPFYVAASCGSLDVLRLLLEHYHAPDTETTALDERGFTILNAACYSAHHPTVEFLLDHDPPLGALGARDRFGETAILSAVASLAALNQDDADGDVDLYDWVRTRAVHGETVINILLDRGASVDDALFRVYHGSEQLQPEQPDDTVLWLTISRGTASLIKRLTGLGANVSTKQRYEVAFYGTNASRSSHTATRSSYNVTPLHLGSLHWNADGIKAALASCSTVGQRMQLISSRDSHGRVPLHWAASGFHSVECKIPDHRITDHLLNTLTLLLSWYPMGINAQDHEGNTPLYYAIATHAAHSGITTTTTNTTTTTTTTTRAASVTQFLLDHGADLGTVNKDGRTLLHILAYNSRQASPIDKSLLELVVHNYSGSGSGIINHADKNGDTPLHILAQNLRQTAAARFLLAHGAKVHATNATGETAFHTAARGLLTPRMRRNGIEDVTAKDKIKAQDEMMAILANAAGGEGMIDQGDLAGKTPRELVKETREGSHGLEERIKRGPPTRGRGRGCTRGVGTRGAG